MARKVAIGIQDFGDLIRKNCFYVDKTHFVKEWWESEDSVTLITRPRRFGKTLNMSMLEYFFSNRYEGQGEIFEGLSIWKEEKFRDLQGTYPVISLSFANVKERTYQQTKERMYQVIIELYNKNTFLLNSGLLTEQEQGYYRSIKENMAETTATMALHRMADFLCRYFHKKVIILLDEYDTPMQEAYVHGFWDELVAFTRSLFNATFKTNPYLERAVMTGITRVSKESVFSDLNNLKVVTTTSNEYATAFGFTQDEVFKAMDEIGMSQKEEVKKWYDGFVFGSVSDIYNPWSIINFLDTGKITAYWANTSGNSLINKLIREGNRGIKETFETLLQGNAIETKLDEQIVYNQLEKSESAIWSLLIASGYLKVIEVEITEDVYKLKLTNYEVVRMFQNMISGWFGEKDGNYNDFVKALLLDDIDAMNEYMNRVALNTFSSFDTGNRPSGIEPERFYHGFVLGLIVDLRDKYIVTSNRESGFGRYDIMLEPLKEGNAIIIEFKVFNQRREKTLEDTLKAALSQIEEKKYAQMLLNRGFETERIKKYGFAFEVKNVLIG